MLHVRIGEYPQQEVYPVSPLPMVATDGGFIGIAQHTPEVYDPETHRIYAADVVAGLCTADRLDGDRQPGDRPEYIPPSLRWPGIFEAMCAAEVRPDGIDIADAKLRPGVTDRVVHDAWKLYADGLMGPVSLRDFSELLFVFPDRTPVEKARRPELALDEYSRDVMQRSTHVANLDVGSQISISKPIQAPGGRFDVRQPGEGRLFFWDSWPTVRGDATMGAWGRERLADTLDNFAELADKLGGCIPNANATWGIRPQPNVLARMVRLEARLDGTDVIPDERLRLLESHLEYLDRGELGEEPGSANRFRVRMQNGTAMYRFYDEGPDQGREWRDEMRQADLEVKAQLEAILGHELSSAEAKTLAIHLGAGAASGEDFSPDHCADFSRLATIRTADLVSVKQNALMCDTFNLLAFSYFLKAQDESYTPAQRQEFLHRALARECRAMELTDAINEYCIGEEGIPADYDFVNGKTLPGKSLTGVFALSSGLIARARGKEMLHTIDRRFVHEGGAKYTLWEPEEPFNWNNAWPIGEVELIDAAVLYDEWELALEWCDMFLARDEAAYEKYGCLFEKYDPMRQGEPGGGGEYKCVRDLLMSHGAHLKMREMRPWLEANVLRVRQQPTIGAMAIR